MNILEMLWNVLAVEGLMVNVLMIIQLWIIFKK